MRSHIQVFLTDGDKIVGCEPLPGDRFRLKVLSEGASCELTGTREALLTLAGAILALVSEAEGVEVA